MLVHNDTSAFNESVMASFAPAPWLLPRGLQLPYTGLHTDLDRLLEVQAAHVGGYRAVSLIFFNYHQSLLLMNCLYSMSKFAGAHVGSCQPARPAGWLAGRQVLFRAQHP